MRWRKERFLKTNENKKVIKREEKESVNSGRVHGEYINPFYKRIFKPGHLLHLHNYWNHKILHIPSLYISHISDFPPNIRTQFLLHDYVWNFTAMLLALLHIQEWWAGAHFLDILIHRGSYLEQCCP